MRKIYFIIFISLGLSQVLYSQAWTLKLRSSVELRTYKLTNKIDVSVEKLSGASIILYKGSAIVAQMQSDANGDFTIEVPAKGDFILSVTYSGCNQKKFAISTLGVPDAIANDNYKPTFGIEGVIMAKAFPTINYSVLQQPLARIIYTSNGKKFDDDEGFTNQMLGELSKIKDAENILLEKFTSTNNIGDIALSKGDCPLAKSSYEKAMTIIPGERYPVDQLIKVGDCLKTKEEENKKAAEQAQIAAAKLAAEKLEKEKAVLQKAEADKLAREKEQLEKTQKGKEASDKLANDKLVKEKAALQKKEAAEVSAKAKAEADKIAREKLLAEKQKEKPLPEKKVVVTPPVKEKPVKEKAVKEPVKEKVAAEKPKEPTKTIAPVNSDPGPTKTGSGETKYSVPQALGANKYKEKLKRADELFKMKRFTEAKPVYEEALKLKANDPYAIGKLEEIERLKK